MNERIKNIDVALVYELWNEYAAAAKAGDLQRWISLWLDDGIQMAPGAPRRVGKAMIWEQMQRLFDLFDITNMSVRAEQVRILGDWAYTHGAYEFEMTPKDGGETKSYSGRFLDILAKQVDGSWKIAIDCHNYDESSEPVQCCPRSGNTCRRRSTGLGGYIFLAIVLILCDFSSRGRR